MKYLYHSLIICFLLLAGGVSAQQYRVRFDFGASGVFNNFQTARPGAALGFEALINLAPRAFLVPEVGLQQTHLFHDGLRPPPIFFAGQRGADFSTEESYEMKRTSAFIGLGLEQQLHRFRLQVFGRVSKRIIDRITFRESLDFQTTGRPDNLFVVTVKPEEAFSQDVQTGTLRYSGALSFHTGISIRFDLTAGFELGMSYLHAIGASQLERRVISFCENCPVNTDAIPERSVAAETNSISISGRHTF